MMMLTEAHQLSLETTHDPECWQIKRENQEPDEFS